MRNWSFTFENEEDCKKAFEAFQYKFNDTEDMKKKKIFFCALKDKDDTHKIFLGIDDTVAGSFIITTINAFDRNLNNKFVTVKADCKDNEIEFPTNCKIASWWEPDKDYSKSKEESKDVKGN